MPSLKHLILTGAALAATSLPAAAGNDDDQCGLYLAVSSTSTIEEPKWGIYTGKPYDKDSNIGYGDVAIQLHNFLANTQSASSKSDDEMAAEEQFLANVVDFFEQYIWVPASSGGQNELGPDGGRIVTAIPGAGVLGAYHPKLTNTDWNHTAAYHRPLLNEGDAGEAHPGRGAQSHFYDVSLRAMINIPAGMEIFVNYGDNWSPDGEAKEEGNKDDEITQDDHAKIDETITKMRKFFEKYEKDLNDQSKMDIYNFLTRDVMNAAAGAKKGEKIAAMLPPTPDQLKQLEQNGGITSIAEPTAIRPMDWLEKYGLCMDNIRPGASTIPYAGRGAFATRAIPEGGLVSPVPLIQIASEHVLTMHELHKVVNPDALEGEESEYLAKSSDESIGNQLLLNYCFGHPESTLMFFPAGASTEFINHSKDKANARMVWSSHANNHKHWFELTPSQLIEDGNRHLGLLMEIQALRDIEEGEEIFIDYGDEWQEAWDEHVAQWKNLVADGTLPKVWPVRALDINGANQISPKHFLTKEEQKTFPYPTNLQMKCFLVLDMPSDGPSTTPSGDLVRDWAEPEEANSKPAIDTENLFDCNIVERTEDSSGDALWLYTIESEGGDGEPTTIVRKVPHKAIVFVDAPQTSDQFLADGFRHYIGIPDDIFPQGPWRNAAE